jgi:hypothetical protein
MGVHDLECSRTMTDPGSHCHVKPWFLGGAVSSEETGNIGGLLDPSKMTLDEPKFLRSPPVDHATGRCVACASCGTEEHKDSSRVLRTTSSDGSR